MVVVEEAYWPQPQFRHLLQDADHLLPRRPSADDHRGHAPQLSSDQDGSDDAFADQRQDDEESKSQGGRASRPEDGLARVVPAYQQGEQQTGRLDAQRKAFDRGLAIYPIDVEEYVTDGQHERHQRELGTEAECHRFLAAGSGIQLGAQIEGDLGGHCVDQNQREQHDDPARPRQPTSRSVGRGGRAEAEERRAAHPGDRMLFIGECHDAPCYAAITTVSPGCPLGNSRGAERGAIPTSRPAACWAIQA